jgi:hypothetical protein
MKPKGRWCPRLNHWFADEVPCCAECSGEKKAEVEDIAAHAAPWVRAE